LEKAGCEHVKVAAQPKFVVSVEATKDPSDEASTLGGRFYSDVWMKGGREMADEAIRKMKKNLTTPKKKLSGLHKLLSAQSL
jgi:hypothetical protein